MIGRSFSDLYLWHRRSSFSAPSFN